MPLQKRNIRLHQLTAARRPDVYRHPIKGLLFYGPDECKMVNGLPVLPQKYDPLLPKNYSGNRTWKDPTPKPRPRTDYTPDECHLIPARFDFSLNGTFDNEGATFEDEFALLTRRLWVRGWVKARAKFVIGGVEGQATSLSYVRKWLQDKRSLSSNIEKILITGEDAGRDPAYKSPFVLRDKDYRSNQKKWVHAKTSRPRNQLSAWLDESAARTAQLQTYLDEVTSHTP